MRRYATELEGPFCEGAHEVNLDALGWIDAMASRLERGYLLTIDYGDASPLERAGAGRGTLACYQGHHRTEDPLHAPGELDITARVDFSLVVEKALRSGFDLEGRRPASFPLRLGNGWLSKYLLTA